MKVTGRVTPLLLLVLISLFDQGSTGPALVQQYAEEDYDPVQQSANVDNEPAQQYASDDSDDLLYPYGPAQGDNKTPIEDDGTSGEVPLSITFKFFGKEYKSLYVNNNGVISFNSAVSQYTPDPFPLTNGETFVTPFWGDVDNNLGGVVYYRETTDPAILQRITRDMAKHLPLKHYVTTWAFIATWDKVAYYGAASTKVNTFQAVLTTDGFHYFAILNYGDIQWTTGTASDGNPETGLGGTPAQAGFNSGDDTHYFNIPGSRTDEVLKIKSTTNVDFPGRWVFEVDVFKVLGGCSFQAKFAKEGEEFWKESTCNTKCACHDGRVCCEDEPCPENSTCEASGSFFTCKIKQNVCS
ncbi:alpha-tectorin-like isoform X2 [Pseudophryne corroboree]|uniref:alpha-tectorin-like isoform X2 n=1 Tax=Pseudophryne corroboree TaxID=495146 RepID=UPI003081F3CD